MLDCISISKLVIASTNNAFLTSSNFVTSFLARDDKYQILILALATLRRSSPSR